MQHRFLGRTGIRISQLCLGTMTFGAEADEPTSRAIFQRAREAGINCFDCANTYAKGASERVLGRLIADCRDEVVLITKGYFPMGDDPNARGSSRYNLVRAVEASLRRLGTDRIDLYFLHRFDDLTDLEGTLRALEDLVRQGKLLHPAASNFAAWQTAKALGIQQRWGWEALCCVQPMYNLVKRQAEAEILPQALAEGLGVLSYSPLGGGLLSGKYGRERRPDTGRLTSNAMYQVRYGHPDNYAIAERFVGLARQSGHHPASLAIAWVQSHPAITAPIVGARSLEQLEPCLAAAELALPDDLRAQISALSPAPPPATDRNEEASEHNYGAR
jgi:aryl-alcohol dehydrogenase-like predicted oxidoreductase